MNSLIQYREKPLSAENFKKLNDAAESVMTFKVKYVPCVISVKDEYGYTVEKRDYVASGYDVLKNGEIVPELLQSVSRPCLPQHTAVHLKHLESHKPFGRGLGAWAQIVEDLCKDLEGVSEFSIIKICEKWRHDPESTFFPNTAVLLKDINDFDMSIKQLNGINGTPHEDIAKLEQPLTESQEHRKRVVTICGKVARKENLTPEEQEFYDELKSRAKK